MAKRSSSRIRLISAFAVYVVVAAAVGFLLSNRHGSGVPAPTNEQHTHHTAHALHPIVFGISAKSFVGEAASVQAAQLTRMKAIGVTSVRLDANWNFVQNAGPNSYKWAQLDQEINSVRAAGMSVDLVIDGCPPWAALPGTARASAPQPASAAQYANWAAQVARRYVAKGVTTFEIWNEPNDSKFWRPRPNPAFYTKMLVLAYKAIKKVDRSALVIVGGLAPEATTDGNYSGPAFLRRLYADGAKGYFDAVGDHPYCFPTSPVAYEPWSGWSQMSDTDPSLRSVMKSYGDADKAIWITEYGAPSNGPSGVGRAGQAAELRLAIEAAKRTPWIGALYMYTWQDTGTNRQTNADWFGLLTLTGKPKLAYNAVAAQLRNFRR
jgi:hypothetical protein